MLDRIDETNSLIKKHLLKGLNKKNPTEVSINCGSDDNVIYCEQLPIFDLSEETIREVCDKYDIRCLEIQTKHMIKEGAYIGVFFEKNSFKIVCTIKIRSERTHSDLKKLIAIIRNRIKEIRDCLIYELNYEY